MKKLLIGLITLGSVSIYAAEAGSLCDNDKVIQSLAAEYEAYNVNGNGYVINNAPLALSQAYHGLLGYCENRDQNSEQVEDLGFDAGQNVGY